ncbi:hypothetical protein DdX_21887 [Ditylenchus destructor]|uniref:Uncharacterized protein n=1 Tax=Ditylenchus destructor TaxID=166010 RepID=A0AAD4MGK7_9BILA|nr:hypothetical protein DdX_21887 [Ditylenchus destructor]
MFKLNHYKCTNINQLPDLNSAPTFEKFPIKERLKMEQMSPFFDRCGPYLRHLTLRCCPAETTINFLNMAPNVQHLCLIHIKMNDDRFKELAQILPNLKSLDLNWTFSSCKDANDYNPGLVVCFKSMTCLEYLHISGVDVLFDQKSFVQFPPSLKYLDFGSINNAARILSWIAKGCKDLKGLRLSSRTMSNSILQTISQMKSLTYLFLPLPIAHDIGYVFEALTELQALEINTLDETIITGMTKHCKKLEHLSIRDKPESGFETPETILRLASLPRLCSLTIGAGYSKEQTTGLIERLVAIGNLQHINMYTSEDPLEPEVLFEMLRRCKSIKSIDLDFGEIFPDLYSRICQVVDEIDERDREQSAFPEAHPMVEMKYYDGRDGTIRQYKWFRLTNSISGLDAFEKWQYGCLSAGKPEWAPLHLSDTPDF